jgi:hypothetical protein
MFLDIIHHPVFIFDTVLFLFKTQRFGDQILSPSSDQICLDGQMMMIKVETFLIFTYFHAFMPLSVQTEIFGIDSV